MKRFLLKFSLYFIILFIVVNSIAWFSLYAHRNSIMFKPAFLVNNFETSDTLDYIILGGSTGLCTVNSNLIDSVCHTRGLNLSEDDTGAGSYLLMLNFFLSEGFKTKSVLLTADPGRLNDSKSGFSTNDYRILPFIRNDVVYAYFRDREKQHVPFRSFARYVPALAVAYYNQELFYSSFLALKSPKARHRFDPRGNYQYPDRASFNGSNMQLSMDTVEFSNKDIKLIDSICKANNIRLIYYLNPVYQSKSIVLDTTKMVVNHRDLLPSDEYFYDRVHTVQKGSRLASLALAESICGVFVSGNNTINEID